MSRPTALKQNILWYRLLLVVGANGLLTPVIYFFFTSVKGFDTAQALFLIGFGALAKAISEIPTGVVADKVSRKYSIWIGYLILFVCWTAILFSSPFWLVVLLIAGLGIGASFISGADDALLYDSLQELDRSHEFKKIYSASESLELVAFAITIGIGGILGNINLYLPVIAHIGCLLFSVIVASRLVEPSHTKKGEKIEHVGYLTHTKKSIRTIFSKGGFTTGLLSCFISLAFISAVFKSTKIILSPILEQYGLSISTIGFIISIIILIKAVGAFIASKVSKTGREIQEVVFGLSICVMGLLIISIVQLPFVQVFVFILIIGFDNVILTNLKSIVNERIESRQRSTILSLLSLVSRSSEMLFLTSFGWIIDTHQLSASLLFTASWLTVALIILVWTQLYRSVNGK